MNDSISLQRIVQKYRDHPFDLLINNAGINKRISFDALDFVAIREQFETNALAPLRVTREFLPLLNKGAKVIVMGSYGGVISYVKEGGRYGYRISKAALHMVAAILAEDLKPRHIAVGIFDPGYVRTEMTEGRGRLSPTESATVSSNASMNSLLPRPDISSTTKVIRCRGDY